MGLLQDLTEALARDTVKAMMPTWSLAFKPLGLPIVPFSANTQPAEGHGCVDFDVLQFVSSPWPTAAGGSSAVAAAAPLLLGAVPGATAAPVAATSWLDDFILYGGQTAQQRNPNAELAVRL